MFNGMFNDGGCGGEHGGGCFGGCNCTWILLIILFLCCCGGKMRNFSLNVNPCCLILMLALLVCCGGLKIGRLVDNVFVRSPVGVVYCGKRHWAGVFPNL